MQDAIGTQSIGQLILLVGAPEGFTREVTTERGFDKWIDFTKLS